jgi:hypothetical protein
VLRAAGSEVWLEAEAAHATAQIAWESVEEIYQEEMHNAWDPIYEFLGQRPPPDTEFDEDEAARIAAEEAEVARTEEEPDDEEFGVVRNGKFFRVLPKEEDRVTWAEAKVVCEERGGQLASILSQDEHD